MKGLWPTGRFRKFIIVIPIVALVVLLLPIVYRTGLIVEPAPGPTAALTDLTSLDDLRARFNADAGKPRLILLVSPT